MDTTQENKPTETPVTEAVDTSSATPVTEAPKVCTAGLDTPAPAGVCTVGLDTPQASLPFYKKYATFIALAVGVAIIAGAGFFAYSSSFFEPVVAKVNGKKIYQREFDESVALIEQSATQQGGVDLSDESIQTEIRTQALDVLINNALITTSAEEAGIVVTDADIQAKYDELVTELGTQEELTARMAEMGLTEEKLRSNIADRILADRYIESETDIETVAVTDEEIAEFVKAISTGDTKLPPLEEIRPQIEAQIMSQKQQQIITDFLEKLRNEAEIETLI
jgi:peptidyl-prolyl cis-trans isomerase SurA